MKKTFKLLSCVLLLAIFIQCFSFSAIAFNVSADLQDEYNILESIGIFENTNITDDTQYITRAQLVVAAFNMLNLNKDSLTVTNEFADVKSDHFAYKEITAFRNFGYTDGVGDNKFDPVSFVTMQQGAKILLSALGSKDAAEVRGGHPRGYVEVARALQIWNNSYGLDDYMTRDNLVQIIYDTLRTSPLTITGVEGDYVIYETDETQTVFSKYFDIYSATGIVTDINEKVVESEENETIVINGVSYETGNIDVSGYIGMPVEIFYQQPDNSNKKTLVYIYADEYAKIVELTTDDIAGYSDGTYTYYTDSSKEKTATIKPTAGVYYNGAKVDYYDELMNPKNGTVKLVKYSTSSGSEYDTVIIEDYVIAVLRDKILTDNNLILNNNINYYEIADGAIYTRTSNSIKAFGASEFYYKVIDDKGVLSDTSALKKDMVVSIAMDPYCQGAKLVFCKETVEGKIVAISEEDTVTIGEKVYNIKYTDDNGIINKEDIRLGLEAKFKLDHKGDIVQFQKTGNGYSKGALIRAEYDIVDREIDVVLYDIDTDSVINAVVKEDKKVKVNGENKTFEGQGTEDATDEDFGAADLQELGRRIFQYKSGAIATTADNEAFNIIQYKLNSENVLTEIVVLGNTDKETKGYTESDYLPNFRRINTKFAGIDTVNFKFDSKNYTGTIGSFALVDVDTAYMSSVFTAVSTGEYLDNGEYSFFPKTRYALTENNQIYQFVDIYYFDEDMYADLVIQYPYGLTQPYLDTRNESYPEYKMEWIIFNGMGVVKKISKAVTENGEETDKITVMTVDGTETELIVSPKYASDINEVYTLKNADLAVGDIFTYNVENNLAGNFVKNYDISKGETPFDHLIGSPWEFRFVFNSTSLDALYDSGLDMYHTYGVRVDPTTSTTHRNSASTEVRTQFNVKYRLTSGYIYETASDIITISPGNNLFDEDPTNDDTLLYFSIDSAVFIIVDDSTGKVNIRYGSLADVKDYISYGEGASEVVANMNNGAMKAFIIYNH